MEFFVRVTSSPNKSVCRALRGLPKLLADLPQFWDPKPYPNRVMGKSCQKVMNEAQKTTE